MGGFLLAEAAGGNLLVSLNECGPYQDVRSLSQNPAMYQRSAHMFGESDDDL